MRTIDYNWLRCRTIPLWLLFSITWTASTLPAQPTSDPPGIRCVAFSPDGRYFAACASRSTSDGELAIWDTADWTLKHVQKDKIGFPRIAFSPDGNTLALSRFAPETHLIDVESGQLLAELKGHDNHARCATFTPDGSRLITGSYDRTVRIWDASSGKLLETITGDLGKIYHADVSANGRLLAVADADKYLLHLFDLKTLEQTFVTPRMGSLVPHVAFSPDGRLVAGSSWGGYSRLFDVATQALKYELNTNSADWTCFSPDGTLVAVAAQLSIYVYAFPTADAQSAKQVEDLIAEFEKDDYQLRENAFRELLALGGLSEPFLAAAMQSDDPEVRWRTRRLRKRLTSVEGATQLDLAGESECATFSPDGKLLVGGDKKGNLMAWNVADWTTARRLSIPQYEPAK